uniref:Pyridoxal phosphate homeostasis protein n=1 Tax=Moniliophthora roreri TaxID=221103 RepID=A0A0W0EUN8_MONRR
MRMLRTLLHTPRTIAYLSLRRMSTFTPSFQLATSDRTDELRESLSEIRERVGSAATLVAVSKYKPSSDIFVCYENGQKDFGENYVQELVDKAKELPNDIRWHFIGTLQSNKAKLVSSIPNLHTVQTISSSKIADALNKALPEERTKTPLNVLIQVNTSGEDTKSGLPPLSRDSNSDDSELKQLAKYIIISCPKLHLQGLMTIGALELSLNATETEKNADFERLKETRDVLSEWLRAEGEDEGKWGQDGKLLLSMGMSSDFEAALKAGSDIVRVGTGIFGQRKKKEEVKQSSS